MERHVHASIKTLWTTGRETQVQTPQTPEAKSSIEKTSLIAGILMMEMPKLVVLESIEKAAQTASGNSAPAQSATTAPIRARRLALEGQTLDALRAVHAAATASKARQEEAQRFYNKAQAKADYGFWLSMDFWTLDEAIALLLQRDPRVVNRAAIEADLAPKKGFLSGPTNPPTKFTQDFLALNHRAARSHAMTHAAQLTPKEVIAWAQGVPGQVLPAPLLAYLAQLPQQPPANAQSHEQPALPVPEADELRKTKVKRAALLAMSDRWPTVTSDFQHCKDNGLDAAAKAPEHGMWWKEAALDWASRHGKLTRESSPAALGSSIFRMR